MTIDRPDAIIVGSGAGGGSAAHLLTRRGLSVVVLEKGQPRRAEDFLPYDELYFHTHKALIPHVSDDPNIYVGLDGSLKPVERWWNVNMVGGSTMIWDANMPRYTPEDFAVLDHWRDIPDGASMVNWPWTYEEFQPFFEQAEKDWCISGLARQSPAQEPVRDGYEYPMPPLRALASNEFLTAAFRHAGMHPYMGPRAINSGTYDGRPGCSFCGYNQFFGCAVNSRANSGNTVLPKALATGRCDLRTGHCVTRLIHENGKIRGVAYKDDPQGEEKVLEAPLVFVSIQTIESARLFLLSDIPDPNRMIGHYLTYHVHANAELVFPTQPVWDLGPAFQPRTAIGSMQLRDLYVIADKTTTLTKGGKFSIYDQYTCTPVIRLLKAASLDEKKKNVWGKDLQQYMQELRTQGGVYFSFTGDALSMYDNHVELDRDEPEKGHSMQKDPWGLPSARVYYQHPQRDVDLSRYALDRVCRIMTDAGGVVRKYEPQDAANPGYGHVHGTLRAGTDPGAAVLDANCQSHTVQGLYVLDAAFMPTAGASNPTMTLLANAYRVCQLPAL
jgi:choline dehydrogenase-like flavoprotein